MSYLSCSLMNQELLLLFPHECRVTTRVPSCRIYLSCSLTNHELPLLFPQESWVPHLFPHEPGVTSLITSWIRSYLSCSLMNKELPLVPIWIKSYLFWSQINQDLPLLFPHGPYCGHSSYRLGEVGIDWRQCHTGDSLQLTWTFTVVFLSKI